MRLGYLSKQLRYRDDVRGRNVIVVNVNVVCIQLCLRDTQACSAYTCLYNLR